MKINLKMAICLILTFSFLLLTSCAQMQSFIDQATDAFVLDPGDDYNAQDDLDKMMVELSMAVPPVAGKLHPLNIMDDESFQVGWNKVEDATEYAVEVIVNGAVREKYTTNDTKIDVAATNEGGEVLVNIITRRKIEPIDGEAYYIESPALKILIGAYSKLALQNIMKYYCIIAEDVVNEGVANHLYERKSIKKSFGHNFILAITAQYWTLVKEKTVYDFQINLIERSEYAAKEALSCAQYFTAWCDAIESGEQEINVNACDALTECAVGLLTYAQAVDECLIAANKEGPQGIFPEYVTSVKLVAKLIKTLVASTTGGISAVITTWFEPSFDPIVMINDIASIQLEFDKRHEAIKTNFDLHYSELRKAFDNELKSKP